MSEPILPVAARRDQPEKNPACIECRTGQKPEWAADGMTPAHRIGTAAIKCPAGGQET